MKLLNFPASQADVPRDYPVRRKGDWAGVWGYAMGLAYWLGFHFRSVPFAIAWVVAHVAAGVATIAWAPSPWLVFVWVASFATYIVGVALRLDEVARDAWDRLHQYIGGVVYPAGGIDTTLPENVVWHEGAHVWQRGRYRLHGIRYTLDPRGLPVPWLRDRLPYYRAHSEAQAYGLEVARGYLTTSQAAAKLVRSWYMTGLSAPEAYDMIAAYAREWVKRARAE